MQNTQDIQKTERKKTVLIIDDSAFMRGLIKSTLKRHGFRVIGEAENGKIGAEKYKLLKPDIVTSDIIMDNVGGTGEEGGLTGLEYIMAHNPEAKVIMVSSMMRQKAYVNDVMAKGAKAVLEKPFKEEVLVEIVKRVAEM